MSSFLFFLLLIIGGLAISIVLAAYLIKQYRIRRITDSKRDHYRRR